MIKVELADITEATTEVIVNAANGIGILGAGVAGAIRNAAGFEVQNEAKEVCRNNKSITEGSFYVTGSGKLIKNGVKNIYHAVTMKYPGGLTSLHTINLVLTKFLDFAVKNKVKSISIPGLGTGIGGLDKEQVARIMVGVIKNYDKKIDIKIIDRSITFIEAIKKELDIKE
jgi:O-acetyl-ADP-ribose deacetylase (regulator of RNase III)